MGHTQCVREGRVIGSLLHAARVDLVHVRPLKLICIADPVTTPSRLVIPVISCAHSKQKQGRWCRMQDEAEANKQQHVGCVDRVLHKMVHTPGHQLLRGGNAIICLRAHGIGMVREQIR